MGGRAGAGGLLIGNSTFDWGDGGVIFAHRGRGRSKVADVDEAAGLLAPDIQSKEEDRHRRE